MWNNGEQLCATVKCDASDACHNAKVCKDGKCFSGSAKKDGTKCQ